jgi:hypothetical protein
LKTLPNNPQPINPVWQGRKRLQTVSASGELSPDLGRFTDEFAGNQQRGIGRIDHAHA